MNKTVQIREEAYIQFTDEEMVELGLKKGDKFTVDIRDDGSIKLIPFSTIELDFSEFSKEELQDMIIDSVKKDQTIEEWVEDTLSTVVERFDNDNW